MTPPEIRRATPHAAEDIRAAARHPGSAEPTAVHVGSAMHARLLVEAELPHSLVEADGGTVRRLDGIPVLEDADLPAFPGYEIHRDCTSRPGLRAA